MGCNNKQYSGLNDVLDLNVKYTGCEFTIGDKTIKQGDNLRKVLDLVLQNLGLSTSSTNFWFGLNNPSIDIEAKELDYYLQSDGKVWQLSSGAWIDTGINIGGSDPTEPTQWGEISGDINLQTDLVALINTLSLNSSKIGKNLNLDSSGKLNLGIDISETAPGTEAVVISYNGEFAEDGSYIQLLKDSIYYLTNNFEILSFEGQSLFKINRFDAEFTLPSIRVKRVIGETFIATDALNPSNFIDMSVAREFRVSSPVIPSSPTSNGFKGTISWDNDFIYVCVAQNTWKRAALTTW